MQARFREHKARVDAAFNGFAAPIYGLARADQHVRSGYGSHDGVVPFVSLHYQLADGEYVSVETSDVTVEGRQFPDDFATHQVLVMTAVPTDVVLPFTVTVDRSTVVCDADGGEVDFDVVFSSHAWIAIGRIGKCEIQLSAAGAPPGRLALVALDPGDTVGR